MLSVGKKRGMTFGHFNATERTSIQEHPGASMLGRLLKTLIKQCIHVEQARGLLSSCTNAGHSFLFLNRFKVASLLRFKFVI